MPLNYNGYANLYRRLYCPLDTKGWPNIFYEDPLARDLFIYFIVFAYWEDQTKTPAGWDRPLKRGELLTSIGVLVKLTKSTKKRIANKLDLLVKKGKIGVKTLGTKKGKVGTRITVLNYDEHQPNATEVGKVKGKIEGKVSGKKGECNKKLKHKKKNTKKEIPDLTSQVEMFKEDTQIDLLQIWNANCGCLPKAKSWSDKRKRSAKKILKLSTDPDHFAAVVRKIAGWEFGQGKNDRKWKASFDYFLREETFLKAEEGFFGETPQKNNFQEL